MKPILPLLSASLLLALPAQAQHAEWAAALANERIALWIGDEALGFAGRELAGERTVKGAPFCATAVHETVQALMDGNRIVRKQSTRLCRDGEGRTRREVQREGAAPVVYLHDPVARESWVLHPDKKTARKLSIGSWSFGNADRLMERDAHLAWSERMRENAERWREWAGQVAERARERVREHAPNDPQLAEIRKRAQAAAGAAKSGEPGVVIENEVVVRVPGASEPERRREVRVIRMQDFPQLAPLPPVPPVPPVLPVPPVPGVAPLPPLAPPGPGFSFSFGLPREGGATTALPPRDIEGVKAHGERTTWTIPAGQLGNEKPIVISREVWRSPELMLTVLSKDSDPRSGEVSYRLENLKRGEPDAQLMKVPGDYEQPKRAPRTPTPGAPSAKS